MPMFVCIHIPGLLEILSLEIVGLVVAKVDIPSPEQLVQSLLTVVRRYVSLAIGAIVLVVTETVEDRVDVALVLVVGEMSNGLKLLLQVVLGAHLVGLVNSFPCT